MKTTKIVKIAVGIVVIGGGIAYFAYQSMQASWSYYYSVDEFSTTDAAANEYSFRLAGTVKPGSVTRDIEKMLLQFTLAGTQAELPVEFQGAVPDNFTEGREVVVEGRLAPAGVFQADNLMTRCESKYQAKVK